MAEATWVIKFGRNEDVDVGTEVVWSAGGLYTGWVASAAATTIVSSSAEDDADKDPAGTGAYTVFVEGVDANRKRVTETVTMNGTGAVTLTGVYLRVYRAYVVTCGSTNSNVGVIQVKHGSTVLAQIDAAAGQTLMAVYTIPVTWDDDRPVLRAYVAGYRTSIVKPVTNAGVSFEFRRHAPGGAWRIVETWGALNNGTSDEQVIYPYPMIVTPGSDLEMRATSSAADVSCSGQFYIRIEL